MRLNDTWSVRSVFVWAARNNGLWVSFVTPGASSHRLRLRVQATLYWSAVSRRRRLPPDRSARPGRVVLL